MSIEKYGVDTEADEELEKKASQDCPKCGKKPVLHGNVLMCPNCGSEPFETEKKRNIAFFKQSFGGSLTSYSSARTLALGGTSSRLLYRLINGTYHRIYVPLHDIRG